MAHYKSIIAYDGTEYHGFQRQADGIPTVQSEIEAALRAIGWRGTTLLAAGRTDAGVHARGQVVSYELGWGHSAGDLTAALNANLPPDIAAGPTEEVAQGFHPRFDALRRSYRYTLLLRPTRDPLEERYAWRRWPAPELAPMQRAAGGLQGRHDFGAFGRAPIPGGHTVRTIHQARWRQEGDRLLFDIEADAFLQHMIRRMTVACLEIGLGRRGLDDLLTYVDRPQARWQGPLAPPHGLCLQAVSYEP